MMQFRKIESSVIDILTAAENGRYQTVGFQRQVSSASEILGNNRKVVFYYSAGDLPKKSGSINGPNQHDMVFNIELLASNAAEGDLETIQDDVSTPSQINTALSQFTEGSQLVNASINELINIVYQILMDAQNIDLGLTPGTVANRWIDQIQKNDVMSEGEYVILTASMKLTCRGVELIDGDSGIPGAKIHDITVDIEGDDVEKAGVTVEQ
jgi:hypothetical protein